MEQLLDRPLLQPLQFDQLDGKEGVNRELNKACQIDAKNDYAAVIAWLNEYKHVDATYRAYKKEVERLLLWCIYKHNKPLSSLNRADFEDYFKFLADPQPAEIWCAPKGGGSRRRGEIGWRPFVGPLSHSAQSTAITVINSLFGYLAEANYLQFNPLSLIRNRKKLITNAEAKINLYQRILEDNEWQAILLTLKSMPENDDKLISQKERLKFIVKILFFLGLRINELETHTWNSFRKVNGTWWFFVNGKGNKLGQIPVNDEMMDAVIHYRIHLKLSAYPSPDESLPIIVSKSTGKGLSARQINKLLKKLAFNAAEKFLEPDKKCKLRKFSAHWLRHLSASMQDKMGISFKHIRANHRHESDETTRRYVHAFDNERHDDMQKLTLKGFL